LAPCGPSKPLDVVHFLIDAAKQVAKQSHNIIQMLKRFSILDTCSQYVSVTGWRHPISTKFALQDAIEQYNARDLAKHITDNVAKLFCGVSSVADLVHNSPSVKAIVAHRSELSNDIAACLIADSQLHPCMMELAWVRWRP
jgi:hypothetical protein